MEPGTLPDLRARKLITRVFNQGHQDLERLCRQLGGITCHAEALHREASIIKWFFEIVAANQMVQGLIGVDSGTTDAIMFGRINSRRRELGQIFVTECR